MDADKLKGMAVVSIAEGTRLGRVEDVLFDTQALRVAALQIGGEGQHFVIPFDQLKNIGTDAVTVESSRVTQAAGKGGTFGALAGLANFKGLKVVDEAGTYLGQISGIGLEQTSGRVLRVTTHKGGVLGLGGTKTTIDAAAIHSVGPEVVTVAAGAGAPVRQPQAE